MDMAISNINRAGSIVPRISLQGSVSGNNRPPGQTPEESQPMSSEAVNQALQQIQNEVQSMNISVSFSTYGDKNNDISVIVTDKDTGKVIREIPPEDLQNLYTKLGELIGIIFNRPA
ncbi:MAG: flagellar protein FlaG [Syntrophales bacterium]